MPRAGRPPKRKDAPVPAESVAEVQVAPKPAKRRKLENWSAPEKFLVLKAAVLGDPSRDPLALSSIQIPRSTLASKAKGKVCDCSYGWNMVSRFRRFPLTWPTPVLGPF
jgi:hypothetical protein